MLYYLFGYLDEHFDLVGAGLFRFISFRAGAAAFVSLLILLIFGKKLINYLLKKQVGETVRDLGLDGQKSKQGTPTMGGLIILTSILIPTLLFARLDNIYIILLIITTIWMGLIGFIDDYIKVFKKNKEGLKGKFKVVGQIGLGLIVGLVLFFHPDVVIREFRPGAYVMGEVQQEHIFDIESQEARIDTTYQDVRSAKTTIPFVKRNELDYSRIADAIIGDQYTWIIYVLVVILVVTAVSNGANLTDGIDGLAAGTSAIIGFTLGILAYVSGNSIFAEYLQIMYIPYSGELVIFCAAFVGACIGFLWYNSFPAQVFMGDTGSLSIGGIIAVLAFAIRKELLIPILCGIFLIENLSVVMQVYYFKYTKKKYGEGRRIFRMSPLHHHYQKGGIHEAKIVTRFWIMGILLAILSLAILKIR